MKIRLLLFVCLFFLASEAFAQTPDQSIGLTIYCPNDIVVQCRAEVPPANVNSVTAFSSCQGNITITHIGDMSDGQSCPETISRIYFATDECGNNASCTQRITINDVTDPVLVGCSNVAVECLADIPAVTAVDNCDGTLTPSMTEVIEGSCPTIITRKWVVYDACANGDSCTQTITVNDTTDPILSGCPANWAFDCLADVPIPAYVTATDNCDESLTPTFRETIGGMCPTIITRTWVVFDACGNGDSCIQTISVLDDTAPEFSVCPQDTTVATLSDVPPADPEIVSVVDNCSVQTIEFSEIREEDPTRITRVWNAFDGCGNVATCVQVIAVATIPAMTHWGIILLIGLLLTAGVAVMFRRQ